MQYTLIALVLLLAIWYLRRHMVGRSALRHVNQGRLFLEQNARATNVFECASGLQYQRIEAGNLNKVPQLASVITLHYRGQLLNGLEFDTQYESQQSLSLRLDEAIMGWREGLQYIGEGGKIRLFVPAKLAYGHRRLGLIPAGSLLIFDIHLLKVT